MARRVTGAPECDDPAAPWLLVSILGFVAETAVLLAAGQRVTGACEPRPLIVCLVRVTMTHIGTGSATQPSRKTRRLW
jgi:hypothetical protein